MRWKIKSFIRREIFDHDTKMDSNAMHSEGRQLQTHRRNRGLLAFVMTEINQLMLLELSFSGGSPQILVTHSDFVKAYCQPKG